MARAGIGQVQRVRASWTLQPTKVSNVIVQRARTAHKECAISNVIKTANRRVHRIWAAIAAAVGTAAAVASEAAAAGGADYFIWSAPAPTQSHPRKRMGPGENPGLSHLLTQMVLTPLITAPLQMSVFRMKLL
jgi:hypothetical protein